MNKSAIIIDSPVSEEKLEALQIFLNALKIKFKIIDKSPYNSNFVADVLQAEKDIKNGKGKSISLKEFEQTWR